MPLGGEAEEKMAYWDSQVEKEGTYSYYVSSYTTVWVESTGSNVLDLTWAPPLPPPVSVKANPSDRVVDLNWEVPPSLAGKRGLEESIYIVEVTKRAMTLSLLIRVLFFKSIFKIFR